MPFSAFLHTHFVQRKDFQIAVQAKFFLWGQFREHGVCFEVWFSEIDTHNEKHQVGSLQNGNHYDGDKSAR